jgi:hypothetical protein
MNLEKIAKETLRYLFHEYQKGPTVIYSIAPVSKKFKVNAVELSDYLLERGLIRERWIYPDDSVGCRITMKGIEEVDPAFVREKLSWMIGGLMDAGGSRPLLDILEFRIAEYSVALDIVKQLEALRLVVLRHPKNSIVIEITEDGRRFFDRSGSKMMTLMAY